MFDKMANEIDAVCISTPDHTHFPAAMAAMELGKHVFVQKPLAHNIWQVRTLRKAMHYYKVKTQMGNQGQGQYGQQSQYPGGGYQQPPPQQYGQQQYPPQQARPGVYPGQQQPAPNTFPGYGYQQANSQYPPQ